MNANVYANRSIFEVISTLAHKYQATDLSKGFPDFDCDISIKEIAKKSIEYGNHQYTSVDGDLSLRNKLSQIYLDDYGIAYDASAEITVTCGAQEGLFCAVKALVSPGDEVIIFEPFYPFYLQAIEVAGGVPVFIELKGDNFEFSQADLIKSISVKTKLIILNSPHNPTGKVFSLKELTAISTIAIKHDLLIMSDEVYEHFLYDETRHIPIATLEGMRERTITVSTLGKTFCITGWKIGWVCAGKNLTSLIRNKRKESNGSFAAPLQAAATHILDLLADKTYLQDLKCKFKSKRNYVLNKLRELNLRPFVPSGAFFIVCDISSIKNPNDLLFCVNLIEEHGLALIPLSGFYCDKNKKNHLVRFCFAKKEETLVSAMAKLEKAINIINSPFEPHLIKSNVCPHELLARAGQL